jgi:cell division protein FtsB
MRPLRFPMVTRLSFYLRRQWPSLILTAILAALVLNCVYGPMGPRDLIALRHNRLQLTIVRDQMFADHAQLKQRIKELRSDDAFLQRLIRQELGYAHADDFVYRFPDHKTDTGR